MDVVVDVKRTGGRISIRTREMSMDVVDKRIILENRTRTTSQSNWRPGANLRLGVSHFELNYIFSSYSDMNVYTELLSHCCVLVHTYFYNNCH